MKISKMPVVFSAFAFLLLAGLLIKDSSYKPMNLFWTDMFGVFLMPVGVAVTGACFVFMLLTWYEQTKRDYSVRNRP